MDTQLLMALRGIRKGTWTYGSESLDGYLLVKSAERLGLSSMLGDPASLPPYGGDTANKVWKAFGVENRSGVGGIPCTIVHGGMTESCIGNAAYRGGNTLMKAIMIYLPVSTIFGGLRFQNS